MEDKIITFESYYDPMLAHIIRTKLEANGIDCFIEDEHMAGLNPLFNQAGGIKLNIFERDLEKCREIIAEDNSNIPEEHSEIDPETLNTLICPFCASSNVGRIDNDRHGWIANMASFFASILPFCTVKQWHCFNCKQDFE